MIESHFQLVDQNSLYWSRKKKSNGGGRLYGIMQEGWTRVNRSGLSPGSFLPL